MKVELKPIVIHGAPEELSAWQFYQIIYKNKAGEEIWYGTIWLPKDGKMVGEYWTAAMPWRFIDANSSTS